MQPKFYVPVYYDTRDQRVIKWAQRNLTTHELNKEVRLSDSVSWPKGNGNIRGGVVFMLFIIALLAAYGVLA